VGRLGSELEALGFVGLVLGTVGSPGSGPPSGNSGEVKFVNLSEGEATGLGDEEEDVGGEESDCLNKKMKRKRGCQLKFRNDDEEVFYVRQPIGKLCLFEDYRIQHLLYTIVGRIREKRGRQGRQ